VGYTLASGVTFNIEHYYDANGYSTGEWSEIASLIADNDATRREGRFGALPTGHLLLLQRIKMALMQQIETAIGESNRFAAVTGSFNDRFCFFERQWPVRRIDAKLMAQFIRRHRAGPGLGLCIGDLSNRRCRAAADAHRPIKR